MSTLMEADQSNVRQHLYASDGVVIYKDRIVIPPSLSLTALPKAPLP